MHKIILKKYSETISRQQLFTIDYLGTTRTFCFEHGSWVDVSAFIQGWEQEMNQPVSETTEYFIYPKYDISWMEIISGNQ